MPDAELVLAHDQLNDWADVTDELFLSNINFRHPGLAEAGRAFRRGDTPEARAGVVRHFRTRTGPVWPDYMVHSAWLWSSGRGNVRERADLLLAGRMRSSWFPFRESPFATDDDIRRRLGRHTFVPELLTAFDETGDARYLVKLMALVRAAIRVNPLRLREGFDSRFPDWCDGHDPMTDGCILARWFDLIQHPAFRTGGVLTDEFRWEVLRWAWFIGAQYLRYEGARYRDDNHHLYEYGVAPFNVGFNFPEFRHFARMKRFGLAVVRRHLRRTVLADGTSVEHSVPYQQYILTDFMMADAQARANGLQMYSAKDRERLRKWAEFQLWAAKPDGWLCEMGDHVPPDLSYFLADIAGLYPSGFVKWAAARLGYTNVRPATHLADAWKRIKPRASREASKVYPRGGYVAMRDGWSPDARYMLVSARTPHNLNHAHIHWDPMHFVLHAFGRTLIGDPATLYYNWRPDHSLEKRGYHYAMGSHNVLLEDDDELVNHRAMGSFCFWGGDPPVVTIERSALGQSVDFIDMHHDGYAVRRWCVQPCERDHAADNRHRRIVVFIRDAGWVFIDEVLRCPNDIRGHELDQLIHFEPDTDVRADAESGTLCTLNADANVLVAAFPGADAAVAVEPDPYMTTSDFPSGARAPLVGHIRRRGTFTMRFATLLLPYRGGETPDIALEQETADDAMLLTIRRADATDRVLVRFGAPRGAVRLNGLETDARACIIREAAGRVVRASLVDGTALAANGRRVAASKIEKLSSNRP